MKNKLLFGSALLVLCGMALPPVCMTTRAADRLATDLARADLGVKLQVREPNASAAGPSAQSLIGNDPSQSYALAAGTTSIILSLPKTEVVNHFDFVDAGAEGKVTVSVSSARLPFDAAGWREVTAAQNFDGRQLIPCDLGSVEARYVKIDFNTKTAGRISGFNLFGISAAVDQRTRTAGTFHVRVNAGEVADVTFDAANPAPKVVADLGEKGVLDHLACTYEAPEGALDFYLVDNAEGQESPLRVGLNYVGAPSVQPVTNDPAAARNPLAAHKAVYTLDTAAQPGSGRVSADLSHLSGRYLVAAFRPAAHHRSADYKDVKDAPVDAKDQKDNKGAPVFPIFQANAGNSPSDANTPLLPPKLIPPSSNNISAP